MTHAKVHKWAQTTPEDREKEAEAKRVEDFKRRVISSSKQFAAETKITQSTLISGSLKIGQGDVI